MSAFSDSLKKYIGMKSETEIACDPVEQGAVRRYAQAIMYEDPIQANARNPDFDGIVAATSSQGLPNIEPLNGYALLNGGSEIEFFRYALRGERVKLVSHYADIIEKETSKGPIVLVVTESEYRTGEGELLIRTRRTQIRRK